MDILCSRLYVSVVRASLPGDTSSTCSTGILRVTLQEGGGVPNISRVNVKDHKSERFGISRCDACLI
jgi:hypothetical protein